MHYILSYLSNFLPLLIVPMPFFESVCVTVWIRVGSRYEDENQAGIAHFLEHMAFKGGKKYKNASIVSSALESLGAQYNAATSREWTNFYVKVRKSDLPKAFDILSDIILYPRFRDEDIDRERKVIIEEIAMNEDSPSDKVGDIFMEKIYEGNSLGRDIAGYPKTVKKFVKKDFMKFRKKHYYANNMLITVAGGVKEIEVKKIAENYFGSLQSGNSHSFENFFPNQKEPKIALLHKKTEQAHIVLGFLGYPRWHQNRYAENLLATILGKGMSSRLFTEVREKRGLAYSVGSSVSRFTDVGLFETYVGVDPKNAIEVVKVILNEHKKLTETKDEISQKELSKAKEFVKGTLALSLEDSSSVNNFFGNRALFARTEKDIETPKEVFERLDQVTTDEIYQVAKDIFDINKITIAVVGPFENQSLFKDAISRFL
ncbi:MAG: insulinase family protein [Patescibacteria group bacterium]|nr:insulinase family protein [Patescibacteria group bacterium]